MYTIITNEKISDNVGKAIVEAPYIAKHRKAGQFVIVIVDEVGERIPLTIADSDKKNGTITLYYQIVGTSTHKLSLKKKGEELFNVAGPLGHPTNIQRYGTCVCVGGGIGIAAVYPIAVAMKDAGNYLISIIGARNKDLLILEKELKAKSDEMIVTTDDGSHGVKGFVTDELKTILDGGKVDIVVAVGPVPMMKAVSDLTKKYTVKTLVSLNSIMVDGTGMCGGCRVTVDGKKQFTCVDGPEFDAHLVDFDELMKRLNTYKEQEKESFEKHQCKLEQYYGR
ncbi:MAG: sulfide/dihydroorotate dehydrogenase-like FAD/NAD-binding protein [Spirochaetes bacterium]|nr:sulfide/dihydroorotate dehydrogenase-like FAD/NAD-binding protein [Spirochaetota bacterium]